MREKMEMKTDTLGVILSAGWPMALAHAFMTAMILLIFPAGQKGTFLLIITVLILLTFLLCLRLYLGTYLFLPATEIKGARIIARLGKNNDIEISGVLAEEVIVRQGWIEKLCGVCHIRQKGTAVYLRGVKEPEKVRAWIDANFPRERKAAPIPKRKKR